VSQKDGGALSFQSLCGGIHHSTFQHNKARRRGGAVSVGEFSGDISHSCFSYNKVDGRSQNEDGIGGAIYAESFAGKICDCTFYANGAFGSNNDGIKFDGAGGAIFINGDCAFTVKNTLFQQNIADNYGGAIGIAGCFSGLIEDVTFSGNTAQGGGSFACLSGKGAQFKNVNFTDNFAMAGGAIVAQDTLTAKFENVRFANNVAMYSGGAILAQSMIAEMHNVVFYGNSSQYGSAICVGNLYDSSGDASLDLSGGSILFSSNMAPGGAISSSVDTNISANSGDIIFQWNGEQSMPFFINTAELLNPMALCVYVPDDLKIKLSLQATEGSTIYFYDPISTSIGYGGKISIEINSDENATGTILFDGTCGYRSDVVFEDGATVRRGTFALHNGAKFGDKYDNAGDFVLLEHGTLRVAYEQEVREYLVHSDGSFDWDDPKSIATFTPTYDPNNKQMVSKINVGYDNELTLSGTTHFVLPSCVGNKQMLKTNGTVNVEGATIRISFAGDFYPNFSNEYVSLIGTKKNIQGKLKTPVAYAQLGTALAYPFKLEINERTLRATPGEVQVHPQAKAITTGYLSSMTLLNHGADVVADICASDLQQLCKKCKHKGQQCETFGNKQGAFFAVPLSGDYSSYKNGFTIRTKQASFIGGAVVPVKPRTVDMVLGAFVEYGHAQSTTKNKFDSDELFEGGTVGGKDRSYNYGIGALSRLNFREQSLNHFYCEGTCRIGKLFGDWRSETLRDHRDRSSRCRISDFFFGGHLAFGQVWQKNDKTSIDFGGKGIWTMRKDGNTMLAAGDALKCSAIHSVRGRFGAKISRTNDDGCLISSCGVALEQEFSGESKAEVRGYAIPSSSLRGTCAIGSAQVTWHSNNLHAFTVDCGTNIYVGNRVGIRGYLQVSHLF
jgi:predicted outer membrane repeat protein